MSLRRIYSVFLLIAMVISGIAIIPDMQGLTYYPVESSGMFDFIEITDTTEPTVEVSDELFVTPTQPVLQPDLTDNTVESVSFETQHEHVYDSFVYDSNCVDSGYTRYVCDCGVEYSADYVDATGHVFSDWSVVQEATTVSVGQKVRSCSVCDYVESDEIPMVAYSVPAGYRISFDSRFANMSSVSLVSSLCQHPSESDFGLWYDAAVAIYDSLLNGVDSVDIKLTRDTIGNVDDMSDGDIEAAMKIAMTAFTDKFDQTVLCGHVCLRVPKSSYFAGTMHVDIASMLSDMQELFSDRSAYNKANVAAGLYDGMSERDAVIAINNWICGHMYYAYDYYHPLDVLDDGYGNCTSYALLFHAMCKDAGITCDVVSGTVMKSDGESGHAWNRVKIGGTWHYIDVCWNDSNPSNQYLLSPDIWTNHCVGSIDPVYY